MGSSMEGGLARRLSSASVLVRWRGVARSATSRQEPSDSLEETLTDTESDPGMCGACGAERLWYAAACGSHTSSIEETPERYLSVSWCIHSAVSTSTIVSCQESYPWPACGCCFLSRHTPRRELRPAKLDALMAKHDCDWADGECLCRDSALPSSNGNASSVASAVALRRSTQSSSLFHGCERWDLGRCFAMSGRYSLDGLCSAAADRASNASSISREVSAHVWAHALGR